MSDTIGRVSTETHLDKNIQICYTYDERSRVTQRTKVNYNTGETTDETFTYDAAGNIISATDNCCDTDSFSYDKNNRLTYHNGMSVTYDADGNMTSAYHDGSRDSFRYDSTNRLIGTNTNAYTYNAENVRIRNLCGDSETTYVYNTNAKLSSMLMKTTDGVVTKYVYGRGLIGEETNGSFKTYHFDYRGSTVALTDINGNVTDRFEYDTYGKLTSRTGTSDVIFLYNGRDGVVTDSNGLIYMRARYYSPELRRFVNADILAGDIANAVTLNRYAYANANPVSYVDPFGLSADERGDAIWLQYAELASGFGHTGLLLRDSENQWYLFFWGTTNPNRAISGSNMPVIDGENVFQKLGEHNFDKNNLYDDVMQFLGSAIEGKDLSEGITGAIYLEGDFTESVEYIEDLVDSLDDNNNQYNLYTNNCLQVSMDALSKGTFEKYDKQYKRALDIASKTVVPNRAYKGMKTFVDEIDEFMEKPFLVKMISNSPYDDFPLRR